MRLDINAMIDDHAFPWEFTAFHRPSTLVPRYAVFARLLAPMSQSHYEQNILRGNPALFELKRYATYAPDEHKQVVDAILNICGEDAMKPWTEREYLRALAAYVPAFMNQVEAAMLERMHARRLKLAEKYLLPDKPTTSTDLLNGNWEDTP